MTKTGWLDEWLRWMIRMDSFGIRDDCIESDLQRVAIMQMHASLFRLILSHKKGMFCGTQWSDIQST
jgi:hypothetical protein